MCIYSVVQIIGMRGIKYIETTQTPYVNISHLFLFHFSSYLGKKQSIGEIIMKAKVLLLQNIELHI